MKAINYALAAAGLVAASSFAMTLRRSTEVQHPSNRTPVLVELFTSEGCSSCPAADKLLSEIQRDQPAEGVLIVPLSEHVDYWDGPNWKDIFSSSQFSARQAAYVRALRVQSPYTPQMVVDGQYEFVGSDADSASNAIAKAAQARKAKVDLTATQSSGQIEVNISIAAPPSAQPGDSNELYIAVTEDNLDSHVSGGENGGRHLYHSAVVRTLQRIGPIQAGAPYARKFNLALGPSWKRQDISVVVFIQARTSGRILGVGLVKTQQS